MTHYLRNQNNQSILDLELYVKKEEGRQFVELSSSVIIKPYSKLLLDNPTRQDEIIEAFSELSEMRGWLWESYFMGGNNDPEKYKDVRKVVSEWLQKVAKEFDLYYVTD